MCGRYRLDDNEAVRKLLELTGVSGPLLYHRDVAPTMPISIIRQKEKREIVTANHWWLCLDRKTRKPVRGLKSFNSRSDRLYDDFRAAAYIPFRESRCIIPGTAFIEGHEEDGTHHMIEIEGRAIAFGGLYKEYVDENTGESTISASIITLGPHPAWATIHPDSMPLMLDYYDSELVARWLDPDYRDIEYFRPLLEPAIRWNQRITPIGKVSRWDAIGPCFGVPAA